MRAPFFFAVLCAASCMKDFDRFHVGAATGGSAEAASGGEDPAGGTSATGQGGDGSADGGSGAQASSGGDGGGTDGGGGDPSSSGGNGGEPGGGSAGAPSGGSGGEPVVCEAPESACSQGCANLESDPAHCGSCDNSCTLQSAGFTCLGSVCACDAALDCGNPASNSECASGTCVCGGTACVPGETCVKLESAYACSCNGGNACPAGNTCCESPKGCFDLAADDANCGACGRACAPSQVCVVGQCQEAL